MKHFIRILALMLALLTCAGVFAACTKTKTSDDPASESATPGSSDLSFSDPETPSESEEEVDVDIGPTTNVALN